MKTTNNVNGAHQNSVPRKSIIKSAQKVLAEKGLVEASVAEIAKQAGVTDSVIYHYFKNKEDLLFHSLEEKMIEVIRELDFHLEGIIDPVSKLSKMIWFHLYINDLSPEETRTLKYLLFECRSNIHFYSHTGYEKLREYVKIMSIILQEGVDKKIFREDINMRLVRDLILGLLDEESLAVFASREIEQSMPDFSAIMDLILPMILADETPSELALTDDDKRERILKYAEQVFAQKGYNSATISEVAAMAKVAEGTIYTYFKNKKELLFSIPEAKFQQYKNSLDELFDIRSPIRRLRRLIRYHFFLFLADRTFLKILLLDLKLNRQFYESDAYKSFLEYISILGVVLDKGKEEGIFRKTVNNRVFRSLFLGAFSHLAMRWFILKRESGFDLVQEIEEVTSLLCRSVVSSGYYDDSQEQS